MRAFSTGVEIPVIDVSDFNSIEFSQQRNVAQQVDQAFTDFGFAVIIGHGVPDDIFDAAYDSSKRFFRQSIESKRKFDLGLGYGYGGYVNLQESGGQLTGEKNVKKRSDAVESLTCRGLHHLNGSNTQNNSNPIFAQDMSCVPHADTIPEIMHDSVKCLHESLFPFRSVLTRITEISLGANPGDFHRHFDPKKGGVRFAYYPELPPEDFEDKTSKADTKIGYGAHADSGSMVLLRLDRDNPEGTEVWHKGQWLSVPAIEGGIVVNLGTVLSLLTGGRWQAAIHRATRKNYRERLSIVYGAMVPENDLVLQCLTATGQRNRKVTVKEYLDARVRLQRPETSPADREVVDFIDNLSSEPLG